MRLRRDCYECYLFTSYAHYYIWFQRYIGNPKPQCLLGKAQYGFWNGDFFSLRLWGLILTVAIHFSMSVLYPVREGVYVYLFMMKCLHTGCFAFSIWWQKFACEATALILGHKIIVTFHCLHAEECNLSTKKKQHFLTSWVTCTLIYEPYTLYKNVQCHVDSRMVLQLICVQANVSSVTAHLCSENNYHKLYFKPLQ